MLFRALLVAVEVAVDSRGLGQCRIAKFGEAGETMSRRT
jgi:hypothetical protein